LSTFTGKLALSFLALNLNPFSLDKAKSLSMKSYAFSFEVVINK
jgi:hypothetical protein